MQSERVVVDGSRHLASVRAIQNLGGISIGIVASPEIRYQRALDAEDNKQKPQSFEHFIREESADMNAIGSEGGQLLPILWGIQPEHIIDTSDMSRSQVHQAIDALIIPLLKKP